jgi:hypothetical protein
MSLSGYYGKRGAVKDTDDVSPLQFPVRTYNTSPRLVIKKHPSNTSWEAAKTSGHFVVRDPPPKVDLAGFQQAPRHHPTGHLRRHNISTPRATLYGYGQHRFLMWRVDHADRDSLD